MQIADQGAEKPMKKLTCILFAALIFMCVFAAAACAQEPVTTTVMVYMCGSNLESRSGLASDDILEMMDSDFDAKYTNVFLMTGGTQEWSMPSVNADATGIYQLRANGMRRLWQGEMLNMGDGETLSLFLNTVAKESHTDRYVLIFWDHGGGPLNGVCWDENFENDSLSLFELLEGLSESPFAEKKLDMIGFDACLMGSVETAWLLSPYARYMVASEEREPGSGWDYSFLFGMEKDASPVCTGKRIIDAYLGSFPEDYGSALTLSLIDLAYADEIVNEMSAYFESLNDILTNSIFKSIAALRYGVQGYGRDYRAVESADYDMVDVIGLLKACEGYDLPESDRLIGLISEAILVNGTNLSDSYGLSVYFPYHNQQEYHSLGVEFFENTQFCPGYTDFIESFREYQHGERSVDWTGLVPEVTRSEEGFCVSLPLSREQTEDMVSARLILLDSNSSPRGENSGYSKVFGVSDIAREGDAICAEYHSENLVFTYTDGMGALHEIGPIEFIVLDSGEYQLDVLAANLTEIGEASYDDPGVSHMMRLTLSPPDASGMAKVKAVQVYDDTIDRFTNRTGDAIENYKYLYFVSYQRYITREEGLLLPYEAWSIYRDEADGIPRQTVVILDANIEQATAWGFRVKTNHGVRYAAFEITDSRNHTFLTEMTPIRPLSEITLYRQKAVVENMPIEAELRVVSAAPDKIAAWIDLTNNSEDTSYIFEGRDFCINGQPIAVYSTDTGSWNTRVDSGDGGYAGGESLPYLYMERGMYWAIAAPGETVSLFLMADIKLMLETLRTGDLNTMSLSIDIIDNGTSEYIGALENVTLSPYVFFGDVYRNYR